MFLSLSCLTLDCPPSLSLPDLISSQLIISSHLISSYHLRQCHRPSPPSSARAVGRSASFATYLLFPVSPCPFPAPPVKDGIANRSDNRFRVFPPTDPESEARSDSTRFQPQQPYRKQSQSCLSPPSKTSTPFSSSRALPRTSSSPFNRDLASRTVPCGALSPSD